MKDRKKAEMTVIAVSHQTNKSNSYREERIQEPLSLEATYVYK